MRSPIFQPSFVISGRLRSISAVTVNSSFMMGAGPFSFARSSAASQPATAISRETSSVNFTESSAPYFMPRQVMVLPSPRKPMPWRRLRMISLRCCSSGRPLISHTLSSMRVKTFTTSRYSFQSNSAKSVNAFFTKRVRFTEPSRHEPYGGSGCSPQLCAWKPLASNSLMPGICTSYTSSMPSAATLSTVATKRSRLSVRL